MRMVKDTIVHLMMKAGKIMMKKKKAKMKKQKM